MTHWKHAWPLATAAVLCGLTFGAEASANSTGRAAVGVDGRGARGASLDLPTSSAPSVTALSASGAAEVTASAFDPTNLPSLDSIGPQTDITVFLQSGVPAGLRLAALRRAWAMDPAIRDFKGLQENDN